MISSKYPINRQIPYYSGRFSQWIQCFKAKWHLQGIFKIGPIANTHKQGIAYNAQNENYISLNPINKIPYKYITYCFCYIICCYLWGIIIGYTNFNSGGRDV